ncbi:hypothetical protein KKD70_02535, partial [Patescibacteria group bacterium]|nr:hypothetical protein [Patescibacteria group bacterium]
MSNPEIYSDRPPQNTKPVDRSDEIVRDTTMRKKVYPEIKIKKDLENTDYVGLYSPLKNFPTKDLSKHQVEFRDAMNKTRGSIGNSNADNYMNELFKAETLKDFDDKIEQNQIIKKEEITPAKYIKLKNGWEKYKLYRKHIEDQLNVDDLVNKEKETVIEQGIGYKNTVEHEVATKIQDFRTNWGKLNGQQRLVAGITMLIGTSWFLNSNKEGAVKLRDMFKKVAILGIGAYGLNTVSKLSGKSLVDYGRAYAADKSGKRDFFKKAFDTDKYGAESMNAAIVHLGNHDFVKLADKYLNTRTAFNAEHMPEESRELYIAGVPDQNLSKREAYKTMTMLDDKLISQGSSLEKLQRKIKEYKEQARRENKVFVEPTFAEIVTQILQKDGIGLTVKNGKVELANAQEMKQKVEWNKTQKGETVTWWPLTGIPATWKKAAYSPKQDPEKVEREENLNKISEKMLPDNALLSEIIKPATLGLYYQQFAGMSKYQYEQHPRQLFHLMENPTENAAYIIQKEKIGPANLQRNNLHVNTIQNAYNNAIINLRKQYLTQKNGKYQYPKVAQIINEGRLNEFVHPVGGVFQAPYKNGKFDYPTNYIMFLRLTLPGSVEFNLRDKKEWPDGDMMRMMHETPMKKGEKILRSDFKRLAEEKFTEKIDGKEIRTFAFKGAYESFLAKTGLTKNEIATSKGINKIDALLEYFSAIYAGSGMTKAGLIRFLASHKMEKEELNNAYKKALGAKEANPADKYTDKYNRINEITLNVIAEKITVVGSEFSPEEQSRISAAMFNFSNLFVLAMNGDKKALDLVQTPLFPAIDLDIASSKVRNPSPAAKPSPAPVQQSSVTPKISWIPEYGQSLNPKPKSKLQQIFDQALMLYKTSLENAIKMPKIDQALMLYKTSLENAIKMPKIDQALMLYKTSLENA